MVIEDDEDALPRERFNGGVKDLKGRLPLKLWVRGDMGGIDGLFDMQHLIREGEADGVQAERADRTDDLIDRRGIETPDDMEGVARAIPVNGGKLYPRPFGVDDIATARRKRRRRREGMGLGRA